MSDENGADRSGLDIEPLSLERALAVVGEETRASIIAALGEALGDDEARPSVLRYSELMERVGVEDSGRFNYHLNELLGTFVGRVEAEEGYTLRFPGHVIYRAIVAGTLDEHGAVAPFEVGDCAHCGGTLTAEYRPDHTVLTRCSDCDDGVGLVLFVADLAIASSIVNLSQLAGVV